ncbi:MAG TPA: PPC domain-containing DNA-binding protein [Gemmatimonadaceae bacterium]
MKSKLLHDELGQRTFAIVFDTGDEVSDGLLAVATQHDLAGSHFTAIGALRDVTLGYFDWDTKTYKRIPIHEQVEVLSLLGDVSRAPDGTPKVHAHVVVGMADGSARGGHLLEAHVRPTLEVVLTESPTHLQRQPDPVSGLALIRL